MKNYDTNNARMEEEDKIKGAYILLLKNDEDKVIEVGKRKLQFKKGYYLYCGSAMNNLQKRVRRHFSKRKRLRWNIDYVSVVMLPFKAFCIVSNEKIECWLSKKLRELFEGFDEFGASDCSCKTHLYYSSSNPGPEIKVFLETAGVNFLEFGESESVLLNIPVKKNEEDNTKGDQG